MLFIEIKPSDHIHHISTRREADNQMRERFEKLFGKVKIDKLSGISTLGTRVCFYEINPQSGYIEPEAIPDDLVRIKDVAPAHRWSLDVTVP